jgi:hypothetical protein
VVLSVVPLFAVLLCAEEARTAAKRPRDLAANGRRRGCMDLALTPEPRRLPQQRGGVMVCAAQFTEAPHKVSCMAFIEGGIL